MKVKRIDLRNGYKRFHDLTIDLGPDPCKIVALVGPNGCGKSSVLDGLMFKPNALHGIGEKGAKGSDYHSMNSSTKFEHTSIDISLDCGDFI